MGNDRSLGGASRQTVQNFEDSILKLEPGAQDLESADMSLPRAEDKPVSFVPLSQDTAAQNLLASMRQDSERIRRTQIQRKLPPRPSPEVKKLNDEVEDLRRENEIYRSLAYQEALTAPSPSIQAAQVLHLREVVGYLSRENEKLQCQLTSSETPPMEYAPPPPYALY
ncbi:hypothetical protein H0H87_008086 [Tephrocybe sp. NHM501043]|nr:hypothetical protein H0H87_008086 [Tephrocybe sp. NHM501043]